MELTSFAFHIGQLVQVARRTKPGENKPGGIGRIVHCTLNNDQVPIYDVKYIIEGKEKCVQEKFITSHAFLERRKTSATTTPPQPSSIEMNKRARVENTTQVKQPQQQHPIPTTNITMNNADNDDEDDAVTIVCEGDD